MISIYSNDPVCPMHDVFAKGDVAFIPEHVGTIIEPAAAPMWRVDVPEIGVVQVEVQVIALETARHLANTGYGQAQKAYDALSKRFNAETMARIALDATSIDTIDTRIRVAAKRMNRKACAAEI